MRTYRYAHLLAAHGHDVQVFTTADEVKPPFRMYMRPEDWQKCSAQYANGRVQVHWTQPADATQSYIPMATPYVSKLTSLALTASADESFDFVFSFYMEPYGVAGHLISSLLGIPHIIKTAGSDAGRLWKHAQLKPLYDRIFQSAAALIVGGVVAAEMKRIGIAKSRCFPERDIFRLSEVFTADGPALDVDKLIEESNKDSNYADLVWGCYNPDLNYFGLYGKLGNVKGSFSLLQALRRLVDEGAKVGLLVMAHGWPRIENEFRRTATELQLTDRVCQIPFLPSWRVPEFLRRCVAACCLEQDFPITFHQPIIPREVLMSGTCLVGSTEVIKKLPAPQRMVHGYNCIAVKDVNDIEELSNKLRPLAVSLDTTNSIIGRRGRAYALDMEQQSIQRTVIVDRIIPGIIARQEGNSAIAEATKRQTPSLSELAVAALPEDIKRACVTGNFDPHDPNCLRAIINRLDSHPSRSSDNVPQCYEAIELELTLLEFLETLTKEEKLSNSKSALDSIFRLSEHAAGIDPWSSEKLAPYRRDNTLIKRFSYDVNAMLRATGRGQFPEYIEKKETWVMFVADMQKTRPVILVADRRSVEVLELCDGTRPVSPLSIEVADSDELSNDLVQEVIKKYFEVGVLGFRDISTAPRMQQSRVDSVTSIGTS
jgi:glycosyltransferase involved in cell wall biosynthesis